MGEGCGGGGCGDVILLLLFADSNFIPQIAIETAVSEFFIV